MDAATFRVEAAIEAEHWWFVGRRRLFAREIARLDIGRAEPVLDVGTGTGANLRLLRDGGFSNVRGLDANEHAIAYCAEKGLGLVEPGDIARMPFADGSFALVMATDVLEHVDDDSAGMREIMRVLRPGGFALMTVPTFQSLWGLQDEVAQHKRRYRIAGFEALARAAGFDIERRYYFNFLLFAPIWLARQVLKLAPHKLASENEVNSPLINAVLTRVFAFDVSVAPALRPPFGVSCLIVARKPA